MTRKSRKNALEKPGFAFIWKVKLENSPRASERFDACAGHDRVYRIPRLPLARRSSAAAPIRSSRFDTDLGRIEWQKSVPGAPAAGAGTAACPGGMTANVARADHHRVSRDAAGLRPWRRTRLRGEERCRRARRGRRHAEGIGGPRRRAPAFTLRPDAADGRPAGPPRRMPNYLHVLASDGMMHSHVRLERRGAGARHQVPRRRMPMRRA